MERVALHVGVGGLGHQQSAAAHVHSRAQLTDALQNIAIVSRKLLQQPQPLAPQTLQQDDSIIFLILTVIGGIGLLVLITFGIMWCVYASKRRAQTSNCDDVDSPVTDAEEYTDDDKLGAAYLRSDLQRPAGYGAERTLAVSAQLYHYEKQKRELLALEQGNQNDIVPSARDTPPPTYANYTSGNQKTREASVRHEHANDGYSASAAEARTSGAEEEEFAVYEYPGLVTTVGQIEIDNPLFRSPNVNANEADAGFVDTVSATTGMDVTVRTEDATMPFGAMPVQIVRQQPDLLMTVSKDSSAASESLKSKRRSKHTNTSSPSNSTKQSVHTSPSLKSSSSGGAE